MTTAKLRAVGIILFVVGAVAFFFTLREWDAVDRCLDAGGSYNYSKGECDFKDSHPQHGALGSPITVVALLGMGLGVGFIAGASAREKRLNKPKQPA